MTVLDDDVKRSLGNRRLNEKKRFELLGFISEFVLSSDELGSLDTDLARFGMKLLILMRLSGGTDPRSSGLLIRYISLTSKFVKADLFLFCFDDFLQKDIQTSWTS